MTLKKNTLESVRTSNTLRALLLLVGLLSVVGVIYLGQNGQATLTGRQVQDLEIRLERVKRENAQLEIETAQYTLPSQIAERARAMGFRPATISQTIFIVVNNYPNDAGSGTSSVPTPAPSGGASLWDELLTWVGLAPTGSTVEATGP